MSTTDLLTQLRQLSTGAPDARLRALAQALEQSGVYDLSRLRPDQRADLRMQLAFGTSWEDAFANSDADGDNAYTRAALTTEQTLQRAYGRGDNDPGDDAA